MPISISALVPSADDLLALEVEELAGVVLVHLNSHGANDGDSAVQGGKISHHNFFSKLHRQPEYPNRNEEIRKAIMEAWAWLEGNGFLIRDPEQHNNWFFLSRRARQLRSREQFGDYRKATLLPKEHLHPIIALKVYPAFLRGEYDTAVFQAFREIEIAVRSAGNFESGDLGTELMRAAFRAVNRPEKPKTDPGPLTDTTLPVAEQEAMAHLFAGAIGLYKNPQSHRNVPTEVMDAAEVIVFASHLLRIVDRLMSSGGSSRER